MKNKKRAIIILIIIVLILVAIIGLILVQSNNGEEQEDIDLHENVDSSESSDKAFSEINNHDIYYSVRGILDNYISMIKEVNGDQYIEFGKLEQAQDEAISELKSEAIQVLYNTLDSAYIEECGITEDSINELAEGYKQQGDYSKEVTYSLNIEEMYNADLSTNIKLILLKIKINEKESNMMMKLDLQNSTYSIFGQEYIEKYQYNKDTEITNIKVNSESVQSNDYNNFDFVNTDEKYIVNQLFSDYQNYLVNNIQAAYEELDEEYREKKYDNYEEFESYVSEKSEEISESYLDKYIINQYDEYVEYVCLDEDGNYYIFIERSITDCSVILDTYTIDLKDFTDKYNSGDEQIKVGMNIEKIISAINDNDYKYIYNKLDETFRNNTFGNVDNLANYIKENFYENNEAEYDSLVQEGDTFIYELKLKNADNDTEEKDVTIIMKLLEGTDFVMSFSNT